MQVLVTCGWCHSLDAPALNVLVSSGDLWEAGDGENGGEWLPNPLRLSATSVSESAPSPCPWSTQLEASGLRCGVTFATISVVMPSRGEVSSLEQGGESP